ncbi:hypothetical protein HQK29_21550 [Vibrio vulnificus]|nr:hypothetical protein [Vibrio vulnificus]
MSIKQSITFFLLFFGVSFNAFAFLCEINWIDPDRGQYAPWAEVGKVVENGVVTLNEPAFWGTNSCNAYIMVFNKMRNVLGGIRVDSCPEGQEYNSETGFCEDPAPDCAETAQGVVIPIKVGLLRFTAIVLAFVLINVFFAPQPLCCAFQSLERVKAI